MSNINPMPDPFDALLQLSEIFQQAIAHSDGDYLATIAAVRARLETLPEDKRAELDKALKKILKYKSPSSSRTH